MASVPDVRSRALWRRQAWLTGMAVLAFVAVAVVTKVALSDWARAPKNHAEFYVLASITGIAVVALLLAALVHAVRIAQFTFRRGENR